MLEKPLEQKIQTKILQYLKSIGIWCFKVVSANKAGIPDIVGCTPEGQLVAIEVKRPGEKQSALQLYNQELIEKNSGLYIVAESLDDVKIVLGINLDF